MKILTRLNLDNLKQNRVRTAVTITGVALSVMLILTVIGIATSYWFTEVSRIRGEYGDFHIMYENIPGDKLSVLEESIYFNVEYYSNPVEKVYDEDEDMTYLYWIGPYPRYSYEVVNRDNLQRDEKHKYNVFLKYKNIDDGDFSLKMQSRALRDAGIDEPTYRENITLIILEGGIAPVFKILLMSFAALGIGVLAIISAFVIRNSFNISITERVRQFGMLSSVGARPRQIRRMVYQESLIIGLIALPFGVALGSLLTYGVMELINNLMSDVLVEINERMLFFIPWQAYVIIVIVTAIIIFLSAASPAIVASRYSPLFALRSNQDVKIKARKVRTSKLTRRIWGIGGVMARKNLKRSRQKYRTTVISIVLSVTAFVGVMSFMNYGHAVIDLFFEDNGANYVIYSAEGELYDVVLDRFKPKEYAVYQMVYYNRESPDEGHYHFPTLAVVSRDEFARYAKRAGIRNTDYPHMVILHDNTRFDHSDGSFSTGRATDFEVGDKYHITMSTYDWELRRIQDLVEEGAIDEEDLYNKDSETTDEEIDEMYEQTMRYPEEKQRSEVDLEITNIVSKAPMGYSETSYSHGELFISEDYYQINKILYNTNNRLLYIADSGMGSDISNFLEDTATIEKYGHSSYEDYEETFRTIRNSILIIEVLIYGFIAIVSLIGVTNIFNTITTNVSLRAREFAIIKSVGMTSKEFNRMIRLESLMYTSRALFMGLPIGILISYGAYKLFKTAGLGLGWLIPWNAIIISIVAVGLLVAGIMRYSVRKIKKQNIIETIRSESF